MTAVPYEWHTWEEEPAPAPTDGYDAAVLADVPLFFLKLNETAGLPQDSSGQGHHVTQVIHPEALTYAAPSIGAGTGTAMGFAPLGQLRIGTAAWMDTPALTIEVRAKLDAALGSTRNLVARRITNGTTQNTWQLRVNAEGKLNSLLWVNSGAMRQVVSTHVLDTAPHTLGMTYDGQWTRLYVDGVETDAVDHGSSSPLVSNAATSDISVGAWGNDNEGMAGVIGRVSVTAAALPAARMAARAAAAVGTTAPTGPGWVLDEDRSAALVSWTVDYGRADANSKAGPVQVALTLADDRLTDPVPQVGDRFRLALPAALAAAVGLDTLEDRARFTGEVTDVNLDGRNPANASRRLHTVTGVGRLGRAARRPLKARWPVELDGPRVRRTLTEAGLDVGDIDPGVYQLARPIGANAGPLLDAVVDSAGGSVVEQPTGLVDYHDAQHRRNSVPALTLDASELVNQVRWEQHVGDVINTLRVTWVAGEVTVTDHGSVRRRDEYPGSLSTLLTSKSDAHSVGSRIVARRRAPSWQLPALVADLRRCFDAADPRLGQLLALRHGDRITVAGLPADGPYAGTVDLFVEGWREDATQADWRLALAVSDPTLSGASVRWIDVDPALRWIDVAPTLTWRAATLLVDPAEVGTPAYALDGGAPDTATYARTFDGGAPDTATYARTLDGGTP